MGYSVPQTTVRFAIPVSSQEYAKARLLLWETFTKQAVDEGQRPLTVGAGFLYLWVSEDSVQTSWGTRPLTRSFSADFVLTDYTDIPTVPLLYKVKR